MNIDVFHEEAESLDSLAAQGAMLIAGLAEFITRKNQQARHGRPAQPRVIESKTKSPYRLDVSIYGQTLIFRVELALREKASRAYVAAYRQAYDERQTEQACDVKYPFDQSGYQRAGSGMRCEYHRDDFYKRFLEDVFAKLAKGGDGGYDLRPEKDDQMAALATPSMAPGDA